MPDDIGKTTDAVSAVDDGRAQLMLARLDSLELMNRTSLEQLSKIEKSLDEVRRLVGPFGLMMPNGEMLVQTLYGIKYLIDPADLIMAPNLIIYRQWEADLSTLFWNLLKPDSVFVDVGANFGYFTCLAASRIGSSGKGKVFAVEPNPASLALLDRNVVINWSMCPVSIFRGAVGEFPGSVFLSVPDNRAANASLTASEQNGISAKQVKVDLRRLDDVIPPDIVVDFLKIDVEGHEYAVLRGAVGVIRRSPGIHIVMEWSVAQMREAGFHVSEMASLLDDLDLIAFPVSAADEIGRQEVCGLTSDELGSLNYDNLILVRRNR